MIFNYQEFFDFIMCITYFTTSLCLILSGVIFFSENSIYSTFCLLIIIVLVTLLLLLFDVEFLAIMYLFVYAGAIIVTFLFVIMSVNLRREDTITNNKRLSNTSLAMFLTFIFIFVFSYIFFSFNYYFEYVNGDYTLDLLTSSQRIKAEFYLNDIMIFNNLLYTYFAPYLLLLGFLLLISVVASVSLCLHSLQYTENSEYGDVGDTPGY